jgi:hypothetical protein
VTRRGGLATLAVLGLFGLLTIVATWPLAWHLSSQAPPHQDVYFNMWRLRWFAHAMVIAPAQLFDANIFYPEPGTLALSDAMIVEGIVASPLIWAGMNPVLVQNVLVLAAMAGSGAAMFALARYLTGSRGAGIIAGIIFAFAPYRFEHIMHMELQWAMWSPLAFLALHRTLDTGHWKYGIATGVCVALQILSSIYYGIFVATLIAIAAILLLPRDRAAPLSRTLCALAAGALLGAVIAGAYARPYLSTHARVGDRPIAEISSFSARPSSYLVATPGNWIYGWSANRRAGGPERRLFPGLIPVVLAIAGVLVCRPSRRAIVYLILLVAAFETSLGFEGYAYSFLYEHVSVYRGLRASARLGIFVLMFLGLLAAYGYHAIAASRSRVFRRVLVVSLALGLLVEYRVTLALTPYPTEPPPVYSMLARQARGVVAEFPAPRVDALPGDEARYAYMSTFHWFPLVNGYSGVYPPSYLSRLERLRNFPDRTSMIQLRRDGVRYLIVHAASYPADGFAELQARLRADVLLTELGRFDDGVGPAVLYQMR